MQRVYKDCCNVEEVIKLIENGQQTPWEVIDAALSFLRDENGKMSEQDTKRLMKLAR